MAKVGIRIYEEARAAHLTRFESSGEYADTFYLKLKYDVKNDVQLPAGVYQANLLQIAKKIWTSDYKIVELNEPLLIRFLPFLVFFIFSVRMKDLFSKGKVSPKIVCYAIENLNPEKRIRSRFKGSARLMWPLFRFALKRVIASFDEIAFGTEQAKQNYMSLVGKTKVPQTRYFPPIEPRCERCDLLSKGTRSAIFLGAFEERKGVRTLMKVWGELAARLDGWEYTFVGKGPLLREVEAFASVRMNVEVIVDPSRDKIHSILSRSNVLFLLSESSSDWKEQIGLPILEGLSHGCKIISTSDTGIAEWLQEAGHLVVDDAEREMDRIANAMQTGGWGQPVLDVLPVESGRLAAERWLWRDALVN